MANVDTEGLARISGKEIDNQHTGRGKRGFVYAPAYGTKGTGHDGNPGKAGGINRATKTHPQH